MWASNGGCLRRKWAGRRQGVAGEPRGTATGTRPPRRVARREIRRARRRCRDRSATSGDRLCEQLEDLAVRYAAEHPARALRADLDTATDRDPAAAHSWQPDPSEPYAAMVVRLARPFLPGDKPAVVGGQPTPPAPRAVRLPGARPGATARARFFAQVAAAADGQPSSVIVPSGLSNRIITQGLRSQLHVVPGRPPAAAIVCYRDGSQAGGPFHLRAIPPISDEEAAARPWPVLRLALMSLRHPEQDPLVDGVWLRNRMISQDRPRGQTDDLVYELSRSQLADLTRGSPITIHLYQTGLEPAVGGFYRAVTDALRTGASVMVVPYFYRRDRPYGIGRVWAGAA
jgi:hypothetical protein